MDHFDDWKSFSLEMSDVKPIEQDTVITKAKHCDSELAQLKQLNAAKFDYEDENELTTEFVEPVDPYDYIEFKQSGVQDGVYRKLRLGKYPIEAQLNLHHLSVNQARVEVFKFIKECYQLNIRSILIIHGLGLNGKPYPGVLKSYLNKWLPSLEPVLAMHTALKHHGGYGATYVLIKKSEDKKRENRERHLKRLA
ncbi:DNA endonuclease SmrA [Catenovulum sp. 2E275]|uniref:DNA endonuclease SmrA n=1 Tax=Catenovulum sp. 2E275 TaxID=2980497 RepID=UPI0021D1BD7D|nr:DNA endonuclease SmrA [Catenovulum sp. 2E275]MCU4674675.1 DNA endonuclease SmrA [Catenovulum sp. 2E275]